LIGGSGPDAIASIASSPISNEDTAVRSHAPALFAHFPEATIAGITLLALLFTAGTSLAGEKESAALKAQFITRIARFVEWPEGTFKNESSPIKVGVLGRSAMLDALRNEAATARVGKRPFAIVTLKHVDDASKVHIVVVANSNERILGRTARALRGTGTLSFGPSFTFAESGGTLGMEIYRGKVAFEINSSAAEDEKLRISSKVLKLATAVY
jgi:hypothetical protein